jgi:type VI secretion system protein ImpH
LAQCAFPDKPRIGYSLSRSDDLVRLAQPVFFHTPATTISEFTKQGPSGGETDDQGWVASQPTEEETDPAHGWIYSYQLGLFGPYGALPLHLTEFASQKLHQHDSAFFAFCNVLVHRFQCFFFRAWAEARKEISLDRPASLAGYRQRHAREDIAQHGEETWEFFLGSLIGCGFDSLRFRDHIHEHSRLFYAGRLLPQTRNAEGLRAILEDYLMIPARIIEFQPRTIPIPKSAQSRFGGDPANCRLGFTTIVGSAIVDYQSGFRIRLGPMTFAQFERFLPGTDGFNLVHDWIRLYCGKDTDPNLDAGLESAWDLQLVLLASEVPKLELGTRGKTRLGWSTWPASKRRTEDADDAVLRPRHSDQDTPPAAASPVNEFIPV